MGYLVWWNLHKELVLHMYKLICMVYCRVLLDFKDTKKGRDPFLTVWSTVKSRHSFSLLSYSPHQALYMDTLDHS